MSFEEELGFLEDYDLDVARARLLEDDGRFLEAAELHLLENRPIDAIKDLLKETGSRDAIQKATKIILGSLWHRCSFSTMSKEVASNQGISEILDLADELPVDLLDPLDNHEVCFLHNSRGITFLTDCS